MAGTPRFIDSFVPLYVSSCIILLALYSLFGGEQSHAQFFGIKSFRLFPYEQRTQRRKCT